MTAAAVWLGSWVRGDAASDDLLEAMARAFPDAPAVASLMGARPAPVPELLRAIRVTGADGTWLLLPRPGATVGWPPDAAGAPVPAVLLSRGDLGLGLLRHEASGWLWDPAGSAVLAPVQAQMLTARSGARALAGAVTTAAERLERLGLDRAATASSPRAWELALGRLPFGLDPQVEALLIRLGALHDALDLALGDDGAAVTAGEARARAAEVRAVVGQVQDMIVGVIGGLNAPVPVVGELRARARGGADLGR